jgi:hypothetical protein
MQLTIQFLHFWNGFDPNRFVLFTILQEVAEQRRCHLKLLSKVAPSDKDVADIVFMSVFRNTSEELLLNTNGKKQIYILYTGENIDNHVHGIFPQVDETVFDFHIGYTRTHGSRFRFPLWFLSYPGLLDGQLPLRQHQNDRKIGVSFIASSDYQWHRKRVLLLAAFHSTIPIISAGGVGNNYPIIKDKTGLIGQYYFNLCPENSIAYGYVTEKLFDAVVQGAIPIYIGNIEERDIEMDILNMRRIILSNSFSSHSAVRLLKTVQQLASSKQHLDNFYRQPIFKLNATRHLRVYKRQLEAFLLTIVDRALAGDVRERHPPPAVSPIKCGKVVSD